MPKALQIGQEMLQIYTKRRIPRSAAALSYYLTMTLFPLIICLYSLLGNNYAQAMEIVEFLEQFLKAQTVRNLRSFLIYVESSHSRAMFIAGLMVLVTSSSAAVRNLQAGIGEMQGGPRFQGAMGFLFSVIFSLIFLAAMYFAILVMFTGEYFLELIHHVLPIVNVSASWRWLRFLLLAGIGFVIFWGVYEVSKRRGDRYHCFPGALFATVGLVVTSYLFSVFIAASANYPLVYGSLASLILLMYWLFLCCQVIYLGAALNISLRDVLGEPKKKEAKSRRRS